MGAKPFAINPLPLVSDSHSFITNEQGDRIQCVRFYDGQMILIVFASDDRFDRFLCHYGIQIMERRPPPPVGSDGLPVLFTHALTL